MCSGEGLCFSQDPHQDRFRPSPCCVGEGGDVSWLQTLPAGFSDRVGGFGRLNRVWRYLLLQRCGRGAGVRPFSVLSEDIDRMSLTDSQILELRFLCMTRRRPLRLVGRGTPL
jgi:hypothetical protein